MQRAERPQIAYAIHLRNSPTQFTDTLITFALITFALVTYAVTTYALITYAVLTGEPLFGVRAGIIFGSSSEWLR